MASWTLGPKTVAIKFWNEIRLRSSIYVACQNDSPSDFGRMLTVRSSQFCVEEWVSNVSISQ